MTPRREWTHEDATAFLGAAKEAFPGSSEIDPVPPRCQCDRPFIVDDEHVGPHCLRCGRKERKT